MFAIFSGTVLRSMLSSVMVSKFEVADELASADSGGTGGVPADAAAGAAGSRLWGVVEAWRMECAVAVRDGIEVCHCRDRKVVKGGNRIDV